MTYATIRKWVILLILSLSCILTYGCGKPPSDTGSQGDGISSGEGVVTEETKKDETIPPYDVCDVPPTEKTSTPITQPTIPPDPEREETVSEDDSPAQEQPSKPADTRQSSTMIELHEESTTEPENPVTSPEEAEFVDSTEDTIEDPDEDPPILFEEPLPVESHVHDYIGERVPPTCESVGHTTYHCACGESYDADYVPALGHEWVSDYEEQTIEVTELQCHTFCGVCGMDLTAAGMSVDEILDHTEWHAIHGEGSRRYEEWIEVVIGYEVVKVQVGSHCSRCGINK